MISGNIAASGKPEEYAAAYEFLSRIKAGIEYRRNTTCQIIAAPGNHDCNFDTDLQMRTRLLSSVSATTSRIDEESYRSITSVESGFFDFTKLLTHPFLQDKLCTDISISVGNKKLLLLLFNTAWMSSKAEKHSALIMTKNLFPEQKAKDYDCVISVLHHPFGWFHPDNAAKLVNYLSEEQHGYHHLRT